MSKREKILQIFQDSYEALFSGDYIEKEITVNENTNLIGGDSVLDSIGFVTLFAEVEERLSDLVGDEVFLVFEDIADLDLDEPELTVAVMINYIEGILKWVTMWC